MYIDKLDTIVNEYNKTCHSTIKMKPDDIKSGVRIDFGIKNNEKDATFEVKNHLRISKYKQQVSLQMVWKNFVIKKLKTLAHAIEDFNV